MHFEYNEKGIFKFDGRESQQLTNFVALIVEQTKLHVGPITETTLVIAGSIDGEPLDEIEVKAEQFASMAWVAKEWGALPMIMPLPNAERDTRAAIQSASKPVTVDVYKTPGWTQIGKKPVFLHGMGGITDKGNNPKVKVELPVDLRNFSFQMEPNDAKDSFRASLSLPHLGPPEIFWPMLLATYRSALGKSDFAVHMSGRTGTFKPEICSLFQSHFGVGMHARNLPGSWSSTANALEALAYFAKDTVIVFDDFVPTGTAWQVRTLQKTADQILRAQGNQAGRARLTDRTNLQTTFYPRGLILSTGEDVPEGHSIRARMFILDLTPGDVSPEDLSRAQDARPHYQNAMAHWIQWLAEDLRNRQLEHAELAKRIRDDNRDMGHTRTPQMVGQLIATAKSIMQFGLDRKFIDQAEADRLLANADESVKVMADLQAQYLEAADPADAFVDTVRSVLAGHLAHLESHRGGGAPENPEQLGWSTAKGPGDVASFKSHGPLIGWSHWEADEVYIDVNQITFLKRHASGKLSMTRQTLLKRLKDGGILARTDPARQRNTIRVQANGHTRHVIALKLTRTIDSDEGI